MYWLQLSITALALVLTTLAMLVPQDPSSSDPDHLTASQQDLLLGELNLLGFGTGLAIGNRNPDRPDPSRQDPAV